MESYVDRAGMTKHAWRTCPTRYTLGGEVVTDEQACEEMLRDTVQIGTIPEGTDLARMREQGLRALHSTGGSRHSVSTWPAISSPDETMNHCRWHREKKLPYPTLTRRAQFYIDHPWFLEAGEELPTHKENPKMGGRSPLPDDQWPQPLEHPLDATPATVSCSTPTAGGPTRWSTPTTRGSAVSRMETRCGCGTTWASSSCRPRWRPMSRPGQVIVYNGWEPYMFRGWKRTDGRGAGDGEVAAPGGRLRAPALLAAAVAAGPDRPRHPDRHREGEVASLTPGLAQARCGASTGRSSDRAWDGVVDRHSREGVEFSIVGQQVVTHSL